MDGNTTVNEALRSDLSPDQLESVNAFLIVCKVLSLFITISTAWIALCMIEYGKRRRKWRCTHDGGRIYIACFVPFVLSVPRFVVDHVRFYDVTNAAIMNNCELIADISDFLCVFAILSTYIFLWMRQKAIYDHAFLESINRIPIRRFSWFLLVFICVSSLVLLCGFIVPVGFRASPNGCVEISPEEGSTWATAKFFVIGALTACWQISLVGLFVYPMIRNRYSLVRGASAENQNDERNIISVTIHRSIVCTGVAIFSDSTVTLLGVLAIPWSYPAVIRYTMYDVSVFINLICIVSTFGQNVLIVSVFFRSSSNDDGTTSIRGSLGSTNVQKIHSTAV